jgi:hypothetical protein
MGKVLNFDRVFSHVSMCFTLLGEEYDHGGRR